MSREHVWGQWLKDFVRCDLKKHGIVLHELDRPGAAERTTRRIRAGDPIGSKVRVVCVECNTQWLSQIQDAAKSHMVPLIRGDRAAIGRQGLIKIATWAAMATMTGEFLIYDLRQVAVTASERKAFMGNRLPGDNWRIWIGFFSPNRLDERWVHTSLPIYDSKDIPNIEHVDGAPRVNTQTTTISIGNLFVHTMSSSIPELVADWDWRALPRVRSLLVPIWPDPPQLLTWPVHGLLDSDAAGIAREYFNRTDLVARTLGY